MDGIAPLGEERIMATRFAADNAGSRRRLQEVISRLKPEDFSRTTPDGWTVTALLAHLAFWDNRVFVLLRRWKEHGLDESPIDSEAMNDALKPILATIDPRVASRLSLTSADAVDAEIETLASDLVQAIEASPTHLRFNRGLHRNDHLNQIEGLLNPPRDRPAP
jgi:uncharacterized damage-inducible protein DinB